MDEDLYAVVETFVATQLEQAIAPPMSQRDAASFLLMVSRLARERALVIWREDMGRRDSIDAALQ